MTLHLKSRVITQAPLESENLKFMNHGNRCPPNESVRQAKTSNARRLPQIGRLAWEELLSDAGSNGYMITLGFRLYLDTARAIEVANNFLLRINRRLYGTRFARHNRYLEGAVILEHKHRSTRSSNSPHFHFVVSAASIVVSNVSQEKLRKITEYAADRLLYPTHVYDRPFGTQLSGSDFVDVRRIDSANNLANYLTKDCYRFGQVGDALNIGFFGVGGIEGLSII